MHSRIRRYSSLPIALGLIACASSVQAPTASASASRCASSSTTSATTASAKQASTAALTCSALTGSVPIGTVVQLDGSGSSDPQKRSLSYNWSMVQQPPGSAAVLNNPHSVNPSFTADAAGDYVVQLVVANNFLASQPVQTTITASSCSAGSGSLVWSATNVAATGSPIGASWIDPAGSTYQNVINAGAQVTLSAVQGTNFTDNNLGANGGTCGTLSLPYKYQWALVSAPAGSHAALTASNVPSPSFVPDVSGVYQISAIITDAIGNSTPTKFATITTSSCGANVPSIISLLPATSALGNVNSFTLNTETATVALADNDTTQCPARFATPIILAWSISSQAPAGSAKLSTASGSCPAGATPCVRSSTFEAFQGGSYDVRATATAGTGKSASSAVTFTVSACGTHPPQINGVSTAVAPLPITSGSVYLQGSRPRAGLDSVQLTAIPTLPDSTCGGQSIASYTWNVVSLPSGSAVSVSPSNITPATGGLNNGSILTFAPDVAGTFVFSVSATDANGLTSAAVNVSVSTAICSPSFASLQSTTGSGPPVANTSPVLGQTATISVNGAVTDKCVAGTPTFSYAFTLLTKPASSNVTLPSGTTSATTTVTPNAVGTYQVQLVLTDQGGFSSAPATIVLTAATCGSAKPTFTNTSNSTPFTVTLPPATANQTTLSGFASIGDVIAFDVSANVTDPNSASTCGANGVPLTPYSYVWAVISAPGGSRAQLSSVTAQTPQLKPDVPGAYQISVVVTDQIGNQSAPAFVGITTTNCGANVPLPYIQDSLGNTLVAATGIPSGVTGAISNTLTAVNSNAAIALTGLAYDADKDTTVCNARFNTPTITFADNWRISSRTVGASSSITSSLGSSTTFQAANAGTSKVALTVNSSNGFVSAPLELPITSIACGSSIPTITSTSTLVGSTPTSRPAVGATVSLSAASADADTDGSAPTASGCNPALSKTGANQPVFSWTLISGPAGNTATASGSGAGSFTFTPNVAGTYVYSVTVTYPITGLTSAATQVTIPTGTCGPNLTAISATSTSSNQIGFAVNLGTTPSATGLSSACVAGGALTYAWSLASRPAASAAVVTNPMAQGMPSTAWAQNTPYTLGQQVANVGFAFQATTASGTSATTGTGPTPSSLTDGTVTWKVVQTASFKPEVVGTYQVQLVLTDGGGFSTLQTTTINIGNCSTAPTLAVTTGPAIINWTATNPNGTTTVPNGQINRGDRVQLSVPGANILASTCDIANSATYSFQWTMIGKPPGSSASLSSTTDAQPVFFPDVASTATTTAVYLFDVTIRDSLGNSVTLSTQTGSTQTVGTKRTSTTPFGISDCGTRQPSAPTFIISKSTPNTFETVTLDASGTTIQDPEQANSTNFGICDSRFNNSSYTYTWSSSPSANVTFGAAAATTTFTASTSGPFTVSLVVAGNKDGVASNPNNGPGSPNITVSTCGGNPPIAGNFTATQTFLDGVSQIFPTAAWAPSTTYTVGQEVTNAGNLYLCITSGTSAVSGGPTTMAADITDNTVHWKFQGAPASAPATNVRVQVGVTVTDADSLCSGVLPANDSFTIAWTLTPPASSKATLTNPTTTAPSFTPDLAGTYMLAETSTDATGKSDSKTFTVTTNTCGTLTPTVTNLTAQQLNGAVVFNPSTPQYMQLGLPIQLAASPTVANVSDPTFCAHPVATTSYSWSFLAVPPGSAAAMLGATTTSASFVPDVATTVPAATPPTFYTVQLVATDSLGHSSTSNPLAITAICGAAAPRLNPETTTSGSFWASQTVALASSSMTITHSSVPTDATALHAEAFGNVSFYQGAPVQLFTSNSDNDAPPGCGTLFPVETTFYSWTLVNLPSGSRARLNNPSGANPSFVPDAPGDYDLQLVLTDSAGKSSGPIPLGIMSNGTGGSASLPILPNPSSGTVPTNTTTHVIHVAGCGGNSPTAQIQVASPLAWTQASPRTPTEPLNLATTVSAIASDGDANALDTTTVAPHFAATGCGLPVTFAYKWSMTSVPAASTTNFTPAGSTLSNPSVTPDLAGTYQFAVDVTASGRTGHVTGSFTAASGTTQIGSTSAGAARFTSIANDPTTGNPVIASLDTSTGAISVRRCTAGCTAPGATWVSLPAVDTIGAAAYSFTLYNDPSPLSMKVGPDGTIWVAYNTGTGTFFGAGATTTAAGATRCSLYVASSAPPYASWISQPVQAATVIPISGTTTSASCNPDDTGSASFSTAGFDEAVILTYGRWLSMALDSAGKPSFAASFEEYVPFVGSGPGSATAPVALRDLDYRACSVSTSGGCGTGGVNLTPLLQFTGTGYDNGGRWPSLRFDSGNKPAIAFYSSDASHLLNFIRCPATNPSVPACSTGTADGWPASPTVVDSGVNDVGRFASLDFASPNTLGNQTTSDQPRVAYFDATQKNLDFAFFDTSWHPTAVDTSIDPGGVGTSIGLVIDSATGAPRIAYGKSNTLTIVSTGSFTSGGSAFITLAPSGLGISIAPSQTGGLEIAHQGSSSSTPILEYSAVGQ